MRLESLWLQIARKFNLFITRAKERNLEDNMLLAGQKLGGPVDQDSFASSPARTSVSSHCIQRHQAVSFTTTTIQVVDLQRPRRLLQCMMAVNREQFQNSTISRKPRTNRKDRKCDQGELARKFSASSSRSPVNQKRTAARGKAIGSGKIPLRNRVLDNKQI